MAEVERLVYRIDGDIDGLKRALAEAQRELDKLRPRGGGGPQNPFNPLNQAALNFNRTLGLLKAGIAGIGLVALGNDVIQTGLKFQRIELILQQATGSLEATRREMEFVRRTANEMGANLLTAGQAYAKLVAAARPMGLTLEDTRKIFEGVSAAARASGLSAHESEGAFLALQQMIAKGRVQAEELRGQLGERIPSAIADMAAALGYGEGQLDQFYKRLETGGIDSVTAVTALADLWRRKFGDMTSDAAQAQKRITDFENAIIELKLAVARGGLLEVFTKSMQDLGDVLSDPRVVQGAQAFGKAIKDLIAFAAENKETLALIAGAFIGAKMFGAAGSAVGGRVGAIAGGLAGAGGGALGAYLGIGKLKEAAQDVPWTGDAKSALQIELEAINAELEQAVTTAQQLRDALDAPGTPAGMRGPLDAQYRVALADIDRLELRRYAVEQQMRAKDFSAQRYPGGGARSIDSDVKAIDAELAKLEKKTKGEDAPLIALEKQLEALLPVGDQVVRLTADTAAQMDSLRARIAAIKQTSAATAFAGLKDSLDAENRALQASIEGREHLLPLLEAEAKLRKEIGEGFTDAQRAEGEALAEQNRALQRMKAAQDELRETALSFARSLEDGAVEAISRAAQEGEFSLKDTARAFGAQLYAEIVRAFAIRPALNLALGALGLSGPSGGGALGASGFDLLGLAGAANNVSGLLGGPSLSLASLFGGGGGLGAALSAASAAVPAGATIAGSSAAWAAAEGTLAATAGGGLFGGGGVLGLGAAGGPIALAGILGATLLGGKLLGGKPSVGPNSNAAISVRDGQFVITAAGADNGGSTQQAVAEAQRAVEILNGLAAQLGVTPRFIPAQMISGGKLGPIPNNNVVIGQEGVVSSAANVVEALLRGGALGDLTEEQIAAALAGQSPLAEELGALVEALQEQTAETRRSADAYARASARLFETVDRLRIGDASPLDPLARLQEARAQFAAVVAAARSGDVDALGRAGEVGSDLLGVSRQYFASTLPYAQEFEAVTAELEALGVSAGLQAGMEAEQLAALEAIETAIREQGLAATETLKGLLASLTAAGAGSSPVGLALAALLGAQGGIAAGARKAAGGGALPGGAKISGQLVDGGVDVASLNALYASLAGGGDGGPGFADGGVSWSPMVARVSETGPEAHVPLRSGRIPVRVDGGLSVAAFNRYREQSAAETSAIVAAQRETAGAVRELSRRLDRYIAGQPAAGAR